MFFRISRDQIVNTFSKLDRDLQKALELSRNEVVEIVNSPGVKPKEQRVSVVTRTFNTSNQGENEPNPGVRNKNENHFNHFKKPLQPSQTSNEFIIGMINCVKIFFSL